MLSPQPAGAAGGANGAWDVRPARIRAVRSEISDVRTYEIVLEEIAPAQPFAFAAGQFNMLYLPGIGETAISISSDPGRAEVLLHTVRAVGNVTRALARLSAGDQVLVRGPFGSCWPIDECRGGDVVIAAGGLGLAPLRPVLYELIRRRDQFRKATLLYGARRPSELLYADEYDAWRSAGIDVRTTVDLGDADWTGSIGVVTGLLAGLTIDPAATRVLTCGPEIMMRYCIYEAVSRGVPEVNIYLSMERNMNCAVGLCGHCQFGPKFVCKDGPVFRYDQLEPFLAIEDF